MVTQNIYARELIYPMRGWYKLYAREKYILPESYTKCLIWNHYCLVIYYMLNVQFQTHWHLGDSPLSYMSHFWHSKIVRQDCECHNFDIQEGCSFRIVQLDWRLCCTSRCWWTTVRSAKWSRVQSISGVNAAIHSIRRLVHCTAHCAKCVKCVHTALCVQSVHTVLRKVCVKCVHTVLCVTWQHLFARPIVTWQQCAQSNRK